MFDLINLTFEKLIEGRIDEVFDLGEAVDLVGLATPDPRPLTSEKTIFDWLRRIEKWGDLFFYHKDPENFWGKKKVNKKEFIRRLTDEEINKLFGRWQIKKNPLTKKTWGVTIRREYVNFKGKKYTEIFIVEIQLDKDFR